mgnify:CR=1 FL=1
MASTKIINVLKDDKFEEILDLFKETSAKEVIFVLPKKSKAFTSEEHFIILAGEASKTGKKISLLCSNSGVNDLAKKYGFDVLLPKNPEKQVKLAVKIKAPQTEMEEIQEVLLHATIYCGVPAAVEAFRTANDVVGAMSAR